MSISAKLSDIRTALSSAYSAVQAKGGTVPALPTLNALPSAIQTIPTGGGVSVTPLSVSENGTYTASSGYAYSPVTVSVPTGGGGDVEQYQKVLDRTVVSFSDSTLTSVGSSAFLYCSSLTTLSLLACSYIGHFAFYSCIGLTTVSLPACSYLGVSAFATCKSLPTVSLPVCSYVGSFAFRNCGRLSVIYIGSSICSLVSTATFSSTGIWSNKGSIFVKSEYYDYYKASTNWVFFSNRIFSY